jgi:hypothetical protein
MSDVEELKPARDLKVEDILAMFREAARESAEAARERKELSREMDRRFAEAAREREERAREIDRRFAELARKREEAERKREEAARKLALERAEEERKRKEEEREYAEAARKREEALARQFAETDRKISKLGNRIGELIENLVASNLPEKFEDQGLYFTRSNLNVVMKNADGSFLAEIDIFLENGDSALAVEVKSKLTIADVREHLDRMAKLRRYADEHGDPRKFLGAVAGGIIPDEVKPFAIKNGFFVIEQSGETAIIAVPDDFVPRSW